MRTAIASAEPARHGANNGAVRVVLDRSIAAEDPDETRAPIAAAQPLAISRCVLRREDLRTGAAPLVPLVAPRRQEADVDAQRIRFADDPVHMFEVLVVRF